ncbi:MAG: MBL fold metallo-hydrolase [Candidatus Methylomirabilota bacterium]|jgi:glyoxylase-like metal-dependent hydrolase (beta-lactamase superfamily II)
MDLVKIAGPAHYLPGRVNIGVIAGDGQAALIDTGLDESAAQKAVQAVEQAGLRLAAVINTHSHADHCGGNAFVVKRTGAPIYAPSVEAALIQHTEFEPFFLFGAAPFKAIDSKWFHAAPTAVAHVLDATVSVCGVELEVLPAAGHSMNQVAVATTEVAYLADALMAPEILERYPIQYCYDVLGHRATLNRLAVLRRDWYVGAHFPPMQDLTPLLAANRANLERTAAAVLDALRPAATTEEVVRSAAEALGVPPMDPPAYLLNAAAVKAHLSAHVREGRVSFEIQDQRPLWRRLD